MTCRKILLCASLALPALVASEPAEKPPVVTICIGDGNEWAPYTFWERTNGQADHSKLTGAATQNVLGALQLAGFEYRIKYMPWKRVLHEIEHFDKNQLCEMTWDASHKAERAAFSHYSEPLYSTHLGVFYSTKSLPDGPKLKSAKDINRYALCGVNGYNYDNFPITNRDALDVSTTDINLILKKLTLKRCDLMPSEIEPIYGGELLGAFTLPDDIRSERLPDHQKIFYAIVAKTSPRGQTLTDALNAELKTMRVDGHAEAFYRKYLPEGSGL